MGILQVLTIDKTFLSKYNDVFWYCKCYMMDLLLQRIAIAYLLAAICEIWLKGDDDVDSGLDLLRRYRYQL
jgi:predicted acyltransferase